jgi:Cu(I)/Ag(I) efflux system periplasmic protein CusF
MNRLLLLGAVALAWLSTPALAQHAGHHETAPASAAAPAGALAEGEVRRVDKETKRMTIRHGVIPGLDMPPMTMVFHVQDTAMLDQVKVGQKIRFSADKKGSAYTVTYLEAVQ